MNFVDTFMLFKSCPDLICTVASPPNVLNCMPVIEPWPLFNDSSNSNDYILKEKNGFVNIFKFTMQIIIINIF